MAKVTARTQVDEMVTEQDAPPTRTPKTGPVAVVSAKTQKLINAVTEPFNAYARERIALGVTAAKLAPKFMSAFDAWHGETAGSFIEFVHLINPSVPMQREAYRSNGIYQAADYLRRVVAIADAVPATVDPNAQKPVSPLEAVARLITTISFLVDDIDIVWEAFLQELHWSERQVGRVKKMVLKGTAPAVLAEHNHKLVLIKRPRTGTQG